MRTHIGQSFGIRWELPAIGAGILAFTLGLSEPPKPALVTQTRPATTLPDAVPNALPYLRVVEEKNKSIELQIATRNFQRADGTGPTVGLVGVAHIGDKALYQRLQDLLGGYDIVLYESVKPPGTGGAGGKTTRERIDSTRAAMDFIGSVIETQRLKTQQLPSDLKQLADFAAAKDVRLARFVNTAMLDAWGHPLVYTLAINEAGGSYSLLSLGADGLPGGEGEAADLSLADQTPPQPLPISKEDGLQSQLASALGLKFQLDALNYGLPNWRCSDMAMDEVNRRLEAKGLDFSLIGGTLAGSSLPAKMVKMVLGLMKFADSFLEGALSDTFKVVMIEMLGNPALIDQSLDQLGKGFGEVIVHDRNQIPLEDLKAIIAHEPQVKSVAIFYGAAHMDSMAAQLTGEMGYVPAGEQWITAIKVDLTQSKVSQKDLDQVRRMMSQMTRQMKQAK